LSKIRTQGYRRTVGNIVLGVRSNVRDN